MRDRVYDTAAILKPKIILWKSGELFVTSDSRVTTATVQGRPDNTINLKMPTFHNFTDPLFANGTIFFSIYVDDGYLFAQDAATGKEKWRFKLKRFGLTAPVVAGDVLFAGANDGTFYALVASTGEELWKFKRKGGPFFTVGPAVSDGVVYFTSSEPGISYNVLADGRIHALDALTGQQKWLFKTSGSLSSPAIQNKTLYVGSSAGYLYAIDGETGLEKWKFKAGKGVGAPALMSGVVYFDDFDGNLFAVDADSGQVKWKATKIPKTLSMLALANGVVYYSGAQHSVFAVDGASGQLKWMYQTPMLCKPPIIAGGTAYFASHDGFLYAVDAATGEERWKLESKNTVPSSPIIANGTLYFLTAAGHLYAVR
jgi:outer membrane protein assembly factor BamB